MGKGFNIPWVGGRYSMDKGVKTSWVWGSKYHLSNNKEFSPIHVILIPLIMVYRPPYLWYIKPSYGIMNSSLLVEMRGVQFTMRGFKIQ